MKVAIAGAGVVGAAIFNKLSQLDIEVIIIEKNTSIASETTMANSAIIHSGYDPKPGTLKAKLNRQGNLMYPTICKNLDIKYNQSGSLTLAFSDEQFRELDKLIEKAKINNVSVKKLSKADVLTMVPKINPEVKGALFAPTAGVTYPFEVATAFIENGIDNGGLLYLDTHIMNIQEMGKKFAIETDKGNFLVDLVINATGVNASIFKSMWKKPDFNITPAKGEYFVIDNDIEITDKVLFPMPDKETKGALLIPMVSGNYLVGPNRVKTTLGDKATTQSGLDYVWASVNKIIEVPRRSIIRSFTGLRASTECGDFIIKFDDENKHWMDVVGIDSPGLASAPAIAEYVAQLMKKEFAIATKKNIIKTRQGIVPIKGKPVDEINTLIKKDPRYGNIICKCEEVSEAEIVQAIHSSVPATTVKAIKNRVRPGMGRCQGGFCQPKIIEIIARELNIPIYDVLDSNRGTNIVKRGDE